MNDLTTLNVRMPTGMRDRIRERADINRRSMNSEILHYLDRALAAAVEARGPAGSAIPPGHGPNNPQQEKADEHGNA